MNIGKKYAREAIESTYDCLCDIVEYKSVKNEVTKRTEKKEEIVESQKSCRLSYRTILNASESEEASSIKQVVKLFIAPEVNVKPRF